MAIFSFSTNLLQIIKDSWKEDDDLVKLIGKLESASTNSTKYTWQRSELHKKEKSVMAKNAELSWWNIFTIAQQEDIHGL